MSSFRLWCLICFAHWPYVLIWNSIFPFSLWHNALSFFLVFLCLTSGQESMGLSPLLSVRTCAFFLIVYAALVHLLPQISPTQPAPTFLIPMVHIPPWIKVKTHISPLIIFIFKHYDKSYYLLKVESSFIYWQSHLIHVNNASWSYPPQHPFFTFPKHPLSTLLPPSGPLGFYCCFSNPPKPVGTFCWVPVADLVDWSSADKHSFSEFVSETTTTCIQKTASPSALLHTLAPTFLLSLFRDGVWVMRVGWNTQ